MRVAYHLPMPHEKWFRLSKLDRDIIVDELNELIEEINELNAPQED